MRRKGRGVLRKDRECPPVHGDHGLGLEQTRGMGGLQPVHREEAAHGQQRQIQRIQRTYQLHRGEEAGIARVIEGKAVRHGHDVPCGGPGFRSMERLRHGDPDALHFDGAPDIEADPGGNAGLRHPGVDQAFGRTDDAAAGCAAAFADRHGVTRMIAVIMGDEHQIRLPGLIPRHGAGRVMREEGIYENSHVAARNLKIGMTVPGNGNAHEVLLKMKKKRGAQQTGGHKNTAQIPIEPLHTPDTRAYSLTGRGTRASFPIL